MEDPTSRLALLSRAALLELVTAQARESPEARKVMEEFLEKRAGGSPSKTNSPESATSSRASARKKANWDADYVDKDPKDFRPSDDSTDRTPYAVDAL